MTCPFELSESLNSSASISVFSKIKNSAMFYDKANTQTHIQPVIPKKDKLSRKSLRTKRCFFIFLILGLPIGMILLLRYFLCSNNIIDIPFRQNYLVSLSDENEYQIIELSNKIQMVLVSNTQSSISLFSITIDYGLSNDPDDYKGLSHLVLKAKLNMIIGEYVRKNNNEIKHFNLTYRIDEEMSQVTYEIDKEYFWDSVIYLVSSLISREDDISDSLLDESLEGVNRKFEGFKNSDSFRLLQVINTIIYKKDNFIGNYETLSKNNTVFALKEQVLNAFKQYYIGNNMKIVIETEDNMKVMKEKVSNIFKDISYISKETIYNTIGVSTDYNSQNIFFHTNNGNTLNTTNLGKVIWIQSHLYLRNLKLVFIIPKPTNEVYIYYEYITHLLNQQGNNTLFQKEGIMNEISDFNSKISRVLNTHIQLELNYCLVESGLFSLEDIITQTYSHLVALTSMPFEKERYDEFVGIKMQKILFQEESLDQRKNRLIVYLQHRKTFDDYFSFTELEYIRNRNDNYLIPENSLIILESDQVDFLKYKIFTKNYNANKIREQHFDFTYYLMDLNKETIDIIKSTSSDNINFKWEPNEFITKWNEKIDFDERIGSIEKIEMEPEKIIEANQTIIWHRLDRSFKMPKVIVKINIMSPYLRSQEPNDYFLHTLFFNEFRKQISTKLSSAIGAGNSIEIKNNDNGFTISIIAFSDVIWKILDIIVYEFRKNKNSYKAFEETNDEYYHWKYQNLHQLSRSYFRRIIKYNHPNVAWTPMNSDSLDKIFDSISNNSVFTVLFYGYIYKNEILDKFNEYTKMFHYDQTFTLNYIRYNSPTQAMSIVHYHEEYLGSYIIYSYNNDLYETDQILNNYFQIGFKNDNLIAEASILLAIIHDVARTFLLLGNKRAIEIFNIDNIIYYDFNVEHSTMTPDLIDKHIDIIIDVLHSKISGMKDAEFEAYKNKVMFDLRLTYHSLSHKADLVWNEIYRNTLNFHRITISSFIINYTKANLVEFMLKIFINKQSVRKISIQLYKSFANCPYTNVTRVNYRLNPNMISIVTTNLDILRDENRQSPSEH